MVGAKEGSCEGSGEGCAVGTGLGLPVGSRVGRVVGVNVVGVKVGFPGSGVGLKVEGMAVVTGEAVVGTGVDSAVGRWVGVEDGS